MAAAVTLNTFFDEINKLKRLFIWIFERFTKVFWFTRGDALSLNYKANGFGFSFTGVCISVRKKNLQHVSSAFVVRNVVGGVAIEEAIALYGTFLLRVWVMNHSRKKLFYSRAALYYLRDKMNQASRVHAV